MARCHDCWNLLQVCNCYPSGDSCGFHGWGGRPGSKRWACTCTGERLFECDQCNELNVKDKIPGWGYLCDACFEVQESEEAAEYLRQRA